MKTQRKNKLAKSIFFTILAGSMILLSTSCAQKVSFLNSEVVPAAKGSVKVKQDNNKNYVIDVEIEDLAAIERLQSSNETYVVWMETDQGNTENLGQLKSSSSFLSKQNTASLQTVSAFNPVKIFVTAERGIDVRYPSQVILTTNSF